AEKLVHRLAQKIAGGTEDNRQKEGAGGVKDKKQPPFHAVGSGQNGGQHTQHGNEPAEEDELGAVAAEQELPDLEPRLGQADAPAIMQRQPKPELSADQVAQDPADDGA